MPASTKEPTAEAKRFSFNRPVQFAMGEPSQDTSAPRLRQFSGVAYSGETIPDHWYWGNVVFDLSTMSIPAKLPALIDHDRGQRCGYMTSHTIDNENGFAVQGTLLSNPCGQMVAQDSDDGFPWQMSIEIDPGSVEEVMPGNTVSVNGRQIPGPLTIFRNSTVNEITFTATGYDTNTTARAMSRSGTQPQQPSGVTMDLETLKQELEAAKASNAVLTARAEAAEAKLAQFSRESRLKDLKALFTEVGLEYQEPTDENAATNATAHAFAKMSDEAFAASASVLRAQAGNRKPAGDATLFSHVAQGGSSNAPNRTDTEKVGDTGLVAQAKQRAEQFNKSHGIRG